MNAFVQPKPQLLQTPAQAPTLQLVTCPSCAEQLELPAGLMVEQVACPVCLHNLSETQVTPVQASAEQRPTEQDGSSWLPLLAISGLSALIACLAIAVVFVLLSKPTEPPISPPQGLIELIKQDVNRQQAIVDQARGQLVQQKNRNTQLEHELTTLRLELDQLEPAVAL